MLKKFIVGIWVLSFGLLFLYSFTQVDLGLTLTRASMFQSIQKSFQYIGYFNRPLSTYLFIGVCVALFALFLWTLYLVQAKKLTRRVVWIIVIAGSAILLFSYNAFSYDLFNYIFDAKIVTQYGENPYEKKALDYPQDPMLGFMHWTHRTFPYGPVWLGLTIPLSFLGFGYFIITFYLFKLLIVGSYLLSCVLIEKISKRTKLVDPLFAVAFFALNPFILIEALVSAHIDMSMMAVVLCAVYILFVRKKYLSWVLLAVSVGIKFASILLLPLSVWFPFSKRKNKEYLFILLSILCMVVGVYLQANRTNFQPWYFLLVVPLAALLCSRYYIFVPTVVFSFAILFQYVPFLYTGNFDPPIPGIMNQMLFWSIGISFLLTLIFGFFKFTKK